MKVDSGEYPTTYTQATRILANAIFSSNLTSADVGAVVRMVNTGWYSNGQPPVWTGRIKRVIGDGTCELWPAPTLPQGDEVLGSWHTTVGDTTAYEYATYLSRVRVLVQDKINKLSDAEYQSLLDSAVADYSVDKGLIEPVSISQSGSANLFDLTNGAGDLWQDGYSTVESVEWPVNEMPKSFIPAKYVSVYKQEGLWYAYIDTSYVTLADGEAPNFSIRYMARAADGNWTLPRNDVAFNAVTLLAAAYSCFALASAYALATDTTIVGDAVNYGEKTSKYLSLGREFIKRYNTTVFGAEDPPSKIGTATVTLDLERRASDRGSFIFH